jgi:hypothetical protein
MKKTLLTVLALLSLLGISAVSAHCREDAFNLGLLGAEGNPLSREKLQSLRLSKNSTALKVTYVFPKSPASHGGLQEGDIILGAGHSYLPAKKDPVYALMELQEAATAVKNTTLKLLVLRGGKRLRLKIKLPYLGKHSPTCPRKCNRCAKMIAQSLSALAKMQNKGGSFPCQLGGTNGVVVVTSLCGLAFLASGSHPRKGAYAKVLRKAVDYVIKNCGKEFSFPLPGGRRGGHAPGGARSWNFSQVNWAYAYAGLFLAEVHHHCPNKKVGAALSRIITTLVDNQEPSGGWAHGPGGRNPLGYLELEVLGNWALGALGMAKQLKLKVPAKTISRGIQYIVQCTGGDGGVGYSTHPGQKGIGDPGRTAGAIFAFCRTGYLKHPLLKKMSSYLWRHMESVPNGHVSPVMHFTATALACCYLEKKFWKKFMDTFRLEFIAARRPDGLFSARPTFESRLLRSNTDRTMGTCWTTGSYLLILQLRNGNLSLLTGHAKK